MFHRSFYDAPRTGINFFAIESFDLSARVGESLANCLSIQASWQLVKIMLFSVQIGLNQRFKQWNDLYPQKRCFIDSEVFIFRHVPEDRLLYCRLKHRAAKSVVKILMASLVLFSINRWFQQWNDLHLQNNVLSTYIWCTVKLYCRESCRQATASCFCLSRFSKRHDKMWNGSVWSKMKSMIKTNGKMFWWKPDYKFFRICCVTRVYCNKIIVMLQNPFNKNSLWKCG